MSVPSRPGADGELAPETMTRIVLRPVASSLLLAGRAGSRSPACTSSPSAGPA